MTAQAARVISYPQTESQNQVNQETSSAAGAETDFLTHLAQGGVDMERLRAESQRVRGEIAALKAEKRGLV